MLSGFSKHTLLESRFLIVIVVSLIELLLVGVGFESLIAQTESTQGSSQIEQSTQQSAMLEVLIPVFVAAAGSIVGTLIAVRNGTKLKKLEEKSKEQDAKREYAYFAKKRLYEHVEPLMFLFIEHCDAAFYHVCELTSIARHGLLRLQVSPTYVGEEKRITENDYLKSTIYDLLVPLACFRVMQRELRLYDLKLDKGLKLQYLLTKCIYSSFTDDFYIATGGVSSEHINCLFCDDQYKYSNSLRIHEPKILETKRKHPHHIRYNILGFDRGLIDNLAESLIEVDEKDSAYRVLSFGEFENKIFRNGRDNKLSPISKFCELFSNFHPGEEGRYKEYLLLWRVLLVQAICYRFIYQLQQQKDKESKVRSEKEDNKDKLIDNTISDIKSYFREDIKNLSWSKTKEEFEPVYRSKEEMEMDFNHSVGAVRDYLLWSISTKFEQELELYKTEQSHKLESFEQTPDLVYQERERQKPTHL